MLLHELVYAFEKANLQSEAIHSLVLEGNSLIHSKESNNLILE